jgi:hypothetical protein
MGRCPFVRCDFTKHEGTNTPQNKAIAPVPRTVLEGDYTMPAVGGVRIVPKAGGPSNSPVDIERTWTGSECGTRNGNKKQEPRQPGGALHTVELNGG